MEEIWKDIEGYEGLYQVSNLGRVKALKKRVDRGKCHKTYPEHILSQGTKRGYKMVVLCRDGKNTSRTVHRLVAETFLTNTDNSLQVDHINRDRSDNRISNLRWVTKLENMHNAENTKLYYYKGEMLPLYVLCDIHGKKKNTVYMRIRNGWTLEQALEVPIKTNYRNRRSKDYGKRN